MSLSYREVSSETTEKESSCCCVSHGCVGEYEMEVEEARVILVNGPHQHGKLDGRDEPDQHPMSAITGLEDTIQNLEEGMKESSAKKFATFQEAAKWVSENDCAGLTLSIHNGEDWAPYFIQEDKSITPIRIGDSDYSDIRIIDGGSAAGIQ